MASAQERCSQACKFCCQLERGREEGSVRAKRCRWRASTLMPLLEQQALGFQSSLDRCW